MAVHIKIPEQVEKIIRKLNQANFKAYVVGGCVRDTLLGIEPNDWDVTTDATPEQVTGLFSAEEYEVIPTGIKHGTVTVLTSTGCYEITTFRIDGDYEDNRHPSSVSFSNNLVDDLARRDFTINSMAYHPDEDLFDPFNGQRDLTNKIISAVGDADERFKEDALRMMRAVRFSASLGFDIEPDTFKAIKTNHALISNVSAERIQKELCKILDSNKLKFGLLAQTGLLSIILPELSELAYIKSSNCNKDLLTLTLENTCDFGIIRQLAGLFRYTKNPIKLADQALTRLKFKSCIRKEVLQLLEYIDTKFSTDQSKCLIQVRKAFKHLARTNGHPNTVIYQLLEIKRAEVKNIKEQEVNALRTLEISAIEKAYRHILGAKLPYKVSQLEINGNDVLKLGAKGKEVGFILDTLLDKIIEGELVNIYDVLIVGAEDLIKGGLE